VTALKLTFLGLEKINWYTGLVYHDIISTLANQNTVRDNIVVNYNSSIILFSKTTCVMCSNLSDSLTCVQNKIPMCVRTAFCVALERYISNPGQHKVSNKQIHPTDGKFPLSRSKVGKSSIRMSYFGNKIICVPFFFRFLAKIWNFNP